MINPQIQPFNQGEHKDVALENHNLPMTAYVSSASITGPTLDLELSSSRISNRIRIYIDFTTSGTTGTGTSLANALISSLHIYKGTKNEHSSEPVFKATGSTLVYMAVVAAIRAHPATIATSVASSFLNPAIAGDATYNFMIDLPVNIAAGKYYATMVFNPVSGLAGYSVVPTGLTTNLAIEIINEGQVVQEAALDKQIIMESLASTTGFTRQGVYEAFLMCATELSTVSTISFGSVPLTAVGIRSNEASAGIRASVGVTKIAASTLPYPFTIVNPNLASGTAFYCLWLTSENAKELRVENSAATSMFLCRFA